MEYSVVFTGKILANRDVATVRANVGKLFGITDPERLDLIFSGRTVVLKKGINGARAEKYRAALEGAGALCELRLEASAPAPALLLAEPVIAIAPPSPLPPEPVPLVPIPQVSASLAPPPTALVAPEPAPVAPPLPAAAAEAEGGFTRLTGLKLGSLDDLVEEEPELHIPAPSTRRVSAPQPLLELPDLLDLPAVPAAPAVVVAPVVAPVPAAAAVVKAPLELSLATSSPSLPVAPPPPAPAPAPAFKLGSLEGMSLVPMDGEHAAPAPTAAAATGALAGVTVAAAASATANLRVGAPPPPPPPPAPDLQPTAAPAPAKPAASAMISPLVKEQLFNDAAAVRSSFGGGGYMPEEAQGLCWGGFFFPWLWFRRHASWWVLPALIILRIIHSLIPWVVWVAVYGGATLYLLFKGREMAWNSKRWDSVDAFNSNQRHWAIAGAVLAVIQGYLVYSLVSYATAAKAHPRVSPETAAIHDFQQQQAAEAAARQGNNSSAAAQPAPAAGGMGDLTEAYLNSFKDPIEREKKRKELEAAASRDRERSASRDDRSSNSNYYGSSQ